MDQIEPQYKIAWNTRKNHKKWQKRFVAPCWMVKHIVNVTPYELGYILIFQKISIGKWLQKP